MIIVCNSSLLNLIINIHLKKNHQNGSSGAIFAISVKNEDKWKKVRYFDENSRFRNRPARAIQDSRVKEENDNLMKNVCFCTLLSCLNAAMTSSTSAGSCSDSFGARNFFELGFRYLSPSSDLRNRLLGIKAVLRLESYSLNQKNLSFATKSGKYNLSGLLI